jgi:iron complex outermembrane receptor protein
MKKQLLLIILLCTLAYPQNEKGSIHGFVRTYGSKPVGLANIQLKGTSAGTTSGDDGEFNIKNLSAGNYILVFTRIGYQTKEVAVQVAMQDVF